MSSNNGNGRGVGDEQCIDQLTLTFDRRTMQLDIKGRIYSIDAALAILAQATREYERQLRVQQIAQTQQQLQQLAQEQAVAAAMRKH